MSDAGEQTLVTLPAGARAEKFRVEAQQRLRTPVCYCSVYDWCWLADSENTSVG